MEPSYIWNGQEGRYFQEPRMDHWTNEQKEAAHDFALNVPKLYNAVNPWMTLISLQGKTNFFEKRVGEYSKAGVGVDAAEQVFSTDADF